MTRMVQVVGSVGGDIVVSAPRFPRAGETVLGISVAHHPGGKGANQALAAARAGAPTRLVGRVGDDAAAALQREVLGKARVDVAALIVDVELPTQTALIIVSPSGDNSIVVVPAASGALTPDDVRSFPPAPGDVVVCQMEIPTETVAATFEEARRVRAQTVLNLAPAPDRLPDLLDLVDTLIVNETEAELVLGQRLRCDSEADIADAARSLAGGRPMTAIITLGERGSVAWDGNRILRQAAHSATTVDSTGAGDCFVGYLAAGLLEDAPLESALARASAASALCVQRPGAGSSIPWLHELEAVRLG